MAEVWQSSVPDRKINGILLGWQVVLQPPLSDRWDFEWRRLQVGSGRCPRTYFVLAGLGIGAQIGGTMDALIKGNKLLYRK